MDGIGWFLTFKSQSDENMCVIQAALIQMFGFAGLFWSGCISVSLIRMSFSTRMNFSAQSRHLPWEIVYHLVSWGSPLAMTIYLYKTDQFGPSGPHGCWIKGERNLSRLFFGYGILLVCFLVNLIATLIVLRRMNSAAQDFTSQSITKGNALTKRKTQRKLVLYLVAFGFCWIWGLTNRTLAFADPKAAQDWLFYFQAALEPGVSFAYAVIFAYSENTWGLYKRLFSKKQPRQRRTGAGLSTMMGDPLKADNNRQLLQSLI
jgi:hypothetical protein